MAGAFAGTPRPLAALSAWLKGREARERSPVTLGHRRVYIMPTRLGLMFAVTLLIMLVGSINYTLSLGFMLTFLLAGMGIAGMVHTVRNLARLVVVTGRVESVFAGESAQFRLFLENSAPWVRPAVLVLHEQSGGQSVIDVPAAAGAEVVLPVPAPRRGWLDVGRIRLETRYPLGLFRAWSLVRPEFACLVYPKPDHAPLPPASADTSTGSRQAASQGTDDFAGLRTYQPADSPRHVAWKAAARSEHMLTKQFSGDASARLWLDWSHLPQGLDPEARLSRLTAWVLAAETAGLSYGLRIPGTELEPGKGEAHRTACLTALALCEASR